jgi:hypothetical protein
MKTVGKSCSYAVVGLEPGPSKMQKIKEIGIPVRPSFLVDVYVLCVGGVLTAHRSSTRMACSNSFARARRRS